MFFCFTGSNPSSIARCTAPRRLYDRVCANPEFESVVFSRRVKAIKAKGPVKIKSVVNVSDATGVLAIITIWNHLSYGTILHYIRVHFIDKHRYDLHKTKRMKKHPKLFLFRKVVLIFPAIFTIAPTLC